MMLAFLVDLVQEGCCRVFLSARATFGSKVSMWADMRASIIFTNLEGWDDLMHGMTPGTLPRPPPQALDPTASPGTSVRLGRGGRTGASCA